MELERSIETEGEEGKKKELENKLSALLMDEIIKGKISVLMSEYENTVFDKSGRRQR